NGACKQVFGYEPEEILGTPGLLMQRIHPEDYKKIEKASKEILKKGKVIFEFRIYSKEGSLKYIYIDCVLEKDENGKMVAIHGVSVDWTEKHLASQRLKDASARYQELLESITDAFFAIDKDWKITYANKRSRSIYKFSDEAIRGKTLWEIF